MSRVFDGDYEGRFPSLGFDRPEPGVLRVLLRAPGLNAVDLDVHHDLADVWPAIDRDPSVRAAIIAGSGSGLSAGGTFSMLEAATENYEVRTELLESARALVSNVLECSKPIVSAVHGTAVGAGLVAALLADISIAARTAKIADTHTLIGLPAGDHSVLCWPLLCGMAKAKYLLLTGTVVSGEEAERIGLVSLCVDETELEDRSATVANALAGGSAEALRWTKRALNHWYKAMAPSFDLSLALEIHAFGGPDAREGLAALRAGRPPQFPATPIKRT